MIFQKGIFLSVSPGMVKIFGVKMATELMPYKGTTTFFCKYMYWLKLKILAIIMGPFISVIFLNFVTYDMIFLFLGCFIFIGLYLA